jgi:hypothetical protein
MSVPAGRKPERAIQTKIRDSKKKWKKKQRQGHHIFEWAKRKKHFMVVWLMTTSGLYPDGGWFIPQVMLFPNEECRMLVTWCRATFFGPVQSCLTAKISYVSHTHTFIHAYIARIKYHSCIHSTHKISFILSCIICLCLTLIHKNVIPMCLIQVKWQDPLNHPNVSLLMRVTDIIFFM